MEKINNETTLIFLKNAKEALEARYTRGEKKPVITYQEVEGAKSGYLLRIDEPVGQSGHTRPVPSQELIRVFRAGFKAMGISATLERQDGQGSVLFLPKGLLETEVPLCIAFAGSSSPINSFKEAIVAARRSEMVR